MPLDLQKFVRTRPFLFHLTARQNLEHIQKDGVLKPANDLFAESGNPDLVKKRRRESVVISIGKKQIHIRDQAPLHAGNMSLPKEWSFEQFVAHLNKHVFWWPGKKSGPISYGLRHFERYVADDNVVLVVPTPELIAANRDVPVTFCRYNSGSPRCTGGKPSPRGPNTFQAPSNFSGQASSVIEVTFAGAIRVPKQHLRVESPSHFLIR